MKNLILLIALILGVFIDGRGQGKIGSIGIGFGGGAVNDSYGLNHLGIAFNFYLNGMYNINEHISAGVEYNSNIVLVEEAVFAVIPGIEFVPAIINGILAKGKYDFGKGTTKPYLGVMFGLYNIRPGGIKYSVNGSTPVELIFEKKGSFGFAPELGVQFKSFQISTSFHVPGKYKANIPDGNGGTTNVEIQYFIWQFNIGWTIGIAGN